MSIKKINGWIIISDIINGHLFTRRFMGMSKTEAISRFKGEIKILLQRGEL